MNRDVAKTFCPRSNHHPISQRRVPFGMLFTRPPQRYTVIQLTVISDDGSLSDDNTHSMINQQTSANRCPRMNFYPCPMPGDVGIQPCQKKQMMLVQEMRNPMKGQCTDMRIQQQNFQLGMRCRIVLQGAVEVVIDILQHPKHISQNPVRRGIFLHRPVLP